ncbi:MAG TPA: histidinol phosphate phosphatase domain-containing protein [Anaerolineae bacterium]|nr:histidinol phosphate phosphatase domain-containing protein [Anaerolineae bacterium]
MDPELRIDLHVHSLFSDGVLLPSELLQRAVAKGYGAMAITDHVDSSNMEEVLTKLLRFARHGAGLYPLTFIPGVELTHVPPPLIAPLARQARRLGAALVLVHGETPVEPTASATNRAAVECPDVDLLAHPGFITPEEAQIAAANGVYLEITSRQGHCLTNGHVAQVAQAAGARLVVCTDTHEPGDMIDQVFARQVAAGAGLTPQGVEAATVTNLQALVQRALRRMTSKRRPRPMG